MSLFVFSNFYIKVLKILDTHNFKIDSIVKVIKKSDFWSEKSKKNLKKIWSENFKKSWKKVIFEVKNRKNLEKNFEVKNFH